MNPTVYFFHKSAIFCIDSIRIGLILGKLTYSCLILDQWQEWRVGSGKWSLILYKAYYCHCLFHSFTRFPIPHLPLSTGPTPHVPFHLPLPACHSPLATPHWPVSTCHFLFLTTNSPLLIPQSTCPFQLHLPLLASPITHLFHYPLSPLLTS